MDIRLLNNINWKKKGTHEKQERKDNFLTKIQMKSLILINIVFLIKVITVDKSERKKSNAFCCSNNCNNYNS